MYIISYRDVPVIVICGTFACDFPGVSDAAEDVKMVRPHQHDIDPKTLFCVKNYANM